MQSSTGANQAARMRKHFPTLRPSLGVRPGRRTLAETHAEMAASGLDPEMVASYCDGFGISGCSGLRALQLAQSLLHSAATSGSAPPLCCSECGVEATDGDFDETDDQYYCASCWEAHLQYCAGGAAPHGGEAVEWDADAHEVKSEWAGAAGGGYLQPQVASVRGAAGVDHGRGDSAPAAAQPTGSAS